ncbi:MAG: hypothetical protein KC912_11480 [Proteobacteria bacterium]|nr:hypothetical protein [Pseudomonadota bacterium]
MRLFSLALLVTIGCTGSSADDDSSTDSGTDTGTSDTGDTGDTSDTSDTGDTGSSEIQASVVYAVGRNVVSGLEADAAVLWTAPLTSSGADLTSARKIYDGDIMGFASGEYQRKPSSSADGKFVRLWPTASSSWHVAPVDGSSAAVSPVASGLNSAWAPSGHSIFLADDTGGILYDPATATTLASATWTGDPWMVNWAADGSAVVFRPASGDSLRVMTATGAVHTVGGSSSSAGSPALSPNGARLLWFEGQQMKAADIDGSNASDVVQADVTTAGPADKVVACTYADVCHVVGFDGTSTAMTGAFANGTWVFSADGSKGFVVAWDNDINKDVLYAIDMASGVGTRLGSYSGPMPSPDGSRVVALGDFEPSPSKRQIVKTADGSAVDLGVSMPFLPWVGWRTGAVEWVSTDYDENYAFGTTSIPARGPTTAIPDWIAQRVGDGYVLDRVERRTVLTFGGGSLSGFSTQFFFVDADLAYGDGDNFVNKPALVVTQWVDDSDQIGIEIVDLGSSEVIHSEVYRSEAELLGWPG